MMKILLPWRAGEEFRKLKSEKKWVIALLAVFIPGLLSLAGGMLIQQKQQPLTNQYVEEMDVLTEAQREAMENIQGLTVVIGTVFGIVFIAVAWVLKSVVFHVFARILHGEQVEISSTIHLIAYTYLPFIFKGILDIFRGLTYQPPPYEEFMYQLQHPDVLLNFVREHNIFFIWALILMAIAVREQYNLSYKKAAVAVLLPYIVYIIAQIALTSLSGQLMGGM
ncbi:MAG: hypothetical protein AYK19_00205 [Theionarchaea archaeon DG-70-1]|nr:MAG: hypothetical protein AYK19_00205 [Theionarchaea archaeon DG-70-1]